MTEAGAGIVSRLRAAAKRVRNKTDTSGQSKPVCPHCGYRNSSGAASASIETWSTVTCRSCGKSFKARWRRTVVYDTEKTNV